MPVRGGGDEHGVDIGAVEHVPEVDVGLARPVIPLAIGLGIMPVDPLLGALAAVAPDIADGQHLDVLAGRIAAGEVCPGPSEQMDPALGPDTDEPHGDALAGCNRTAFAKGRGRDDARADHCGPE